jgi:hypothetical protein
MQATFPNFSILDQENDLEMVHNPENHGPTMMWSFYVGGELCPVKRIDPIPGTKAFTVIYTKPDGTPQKWIIRPSDYEDQMSGQVVGAGDAQSALEIERLIRLGTIRSQSGNTRVHPLRYDDSMGGRVWTGTTWAEIVSVNVADTDGKQVVTVIYKADPENDLLTFDMW